MSRFARAVWSFNAFCGAVILFTAACIAMPGLPKIIRYSFAGPHRTAVLEGGLVIEVPRGWECTDADCSLPGLFTFKALVGFERQEGRPKDFTVSLGPLMEQGTLVVAGTRADYNVAQGFRSELYARVFVPDKGLYIKVIGRRRDWELWKGVLRDAHWSDSESIGGGR